MGVEVDWGVLLSADPGGFRRKVGFQIGSCLTFSKDAEWI